MLSNQQFDRTRRLALSLAGIELAERHRELLEHRGRRLGIVDSAGLDLLLGAAEEGEPNARRRLLCLFTTKFTGFFRHPIHFKIAADHAVRAARQEGRAHLWSTAAATGEEPYSLAMALIEAFGCEHPPAGILATDIDPDALAFARRGEYADGALRSLEPKRREGFLCEGSRPGHWAMAAAPRRLVEFRALNLTSVEWFVVGPFDVILCRNVLMYLEACHRYAVLERLASLLAPDGLLMLDPAEHLGKAAHLFTPDADGAYSRRRTSGSARCLPRVASNPHG
jgi:chemotaxis protein methyltransferase CheR